MLDVINDLVRHVPILVSYVCLGGVTVSCQIHMHSGFEHMILTGYSRVPYDLGQHVVN